MTSPNAATQLPTVPFGPVRVTRLIVGGNPFVGNSHMSLEWDQAMGAYYTPERVVATLHRCQAAGVNTFQGRGDYHRVLHWIELFRREGGHLHWIAQTASEMHDVDQNIRILAAAGAVGVYHHGTNTDKHWKAGSMRVVQDRLKLMRDLGLQVGLGTHVPEVVEFVEEQGWDVDFYMTCLYNLSRVERESALVSGQANYQEPFFAEDPERMCQTIRATPKTCLAFKILAAGRSCGTQAEVAAAFQFAFDRIKPQDAVVVGMFPRDRDQVTLNVQHTLRALGLPPSSAPLPAV